MDWQLLRSIANELPTTRTGMPMSEFGDQFHKAVYATPSTKVTTVIKVTLDSNSLSIPSSSLVSDLKALSYDGSIKYATEIDMDGNKEIEINPDDLEILIHILRHSEEIQIAGATAEGFLNLFKQLKLQVWVINFLSQDITDNYVDAFNKLLNDSEVCPRALSMLAGSVPPTVINAILTHEKCKIDYIQIGQRATTEKGFIISHAVAFSRMYDEIITLDAAGKWSVAFAEVKVKNVNYQVGDDEQIHDLYKIIMEIDFLSVTIGTVHDAANCGEFVKKFLWYFSDYENARFTHAQFQIDSLDGKGDVQVNITSANALPTMKSLLAFSYQEKPYRYHLNVSGLYSNDATALVNVDFSPLSAVQIIETLQFGDQSYELMFKHMNSVEILDGFFAGLRIISILLQNGLMQASDVPWQKLRKMENLDWLFLRNRDKLTFELPEHFSKEDDAEPCYHAMGLIYGSQPKGICIRIKRNMDS